MEALRLIRLLRKTVARQARTKRIIAIARELQRALLAPTTAPPERTIKVQQAHRLQSLPIPHRRRVKQRMRQPTRSSPSSPSTSRPMRAAVQQHPTAPRQAHKLKTKLATRLPLCRAVNRRKQRQTTLRIQTTPLKLSYQTSCPSQTIRQEQQYSRTY